MLMNETAEQIISTLYDRPIDCREFVHYVEQLDARIKPVVHARNQRAFYAIAAALTQTMTTWDVFALAYHEPAAAQATLSHHRDLEFMSHEANAFIVLRTNPVSRGRLEGAVSFVSREDLSDLRAPAIAFLAIIGDPAPETILAELEPSGAQRYVILVAAPTNASGGMADWVRSDQGRRRVIFWHILEGDAQDDLVVALISVGSDYNEI